MANIFSVDVEDWFHILELESTPDVASWGNLESRVEKNFHLLLDEFDAADVKVTCFFLGWVAERFPGLVREASQRGHEIASHGYAHQLVYTLTPADFLADVRKTKAILEDTSGSVVEGYRAPGFSITRETPWAYESLAEAGYTYDSSVFPADHGHGGIEDSETRPHTIHTAKGDLTELPVTVASVFSSRMCFFGGGYLRISPYALIKKMSKTVNDEGRPVIYYIHPREVDPSHPRLPMSLKRRFKSYVNLNSTLPKIRKLLREQELVTFKQWLSDAA